MRKYRKPHRIKRLRPAHHILLRQRRRHLKSILKNRFFWTGILSLIILGGIFYFFLFSGFFQIKKVIVVTEERVSAKEIELIVKNELEEKLLFFETKNIFLVNLNRIRKNLLNEFPEIAEIKIKRGFPDTLNLKIAERKEEAIFCQNDDCFFLDEEGVIFATSPEESQLLKIQEESFIEGLEPGQKVIEKKLLASILGTSSKLKNDLKIPLEKVQVVSRERVNFKTIEGWEIYFDPQKDLNWQLMKLKAVLEEEIPPERRKDLEYIELRFGDLASYKYR